jgi:fructose-1-phosphate kinase PfkB-like protein
VAVTQDLFNAGAKSVAISLGAEGMIWQRSAGSDPFTSQPLAIADCSSVGCGDAALAGFAVAHERGLSDEETLRLATACGSANCLAEAPGRVNQHDVSRFATEIQIVRYESERRISVEAN